ncbi:MAG: carboxypeptidase regulatory-like domain-containing protein [Terracidiphilus sp.]
MAGAQITLQAADSSFMLSATSDAIGDFKLPQAPIGVYRLQVSAPGFATVIDAITIASGTYPLLHVRLDLETAMQSVVVHASSAPEANADSVTPTTLITRAQIDQTPGASRSTGMQMITDFVPGSYMTHDMLHMRGGHQTSWLIDGVSITFRSTTITTRKVLEGIPAVGQPLFSTRVS